jgi:cytochrome b subunit of formate dehydrogenase
MRRSPSNSAADDATTHRFFFFEKLIHWLIAIAMFILLITGTILFVPALSAHFPRPLINRIHIDTGITATVVMLLALVGPWGRALRHDLHELMIAPVDQLNSWTGVMGDWLHRARPSTAGVESEKFNVGQRLFTAGMAALAVLAILTGFALRTPGRIPTSLQGGAEFTHEIVFLAIAVLVIGHVIKAILSFKEKRDLSKKSS